MQSEFDAGAVTGSRSNLPTAILLGGLANTTSAARALGRQGIPVVVIARASSAALRSKYVQAYPVPERLKAVDYYRQLLLDQSAFAAGSVIFPCEDAAIAFVAQHKRELAQHYLLDIQKTEHQLQLLDKEKTLHLARQTGIGAPRYWTIRHSQDVNALLADIEYPVLIKPIHSHIFQRRFHKKLFYAKSQEELIYLSQKVIKADIEFMLCEFIPGPDHLLSSYYVYLDRDNQRAFEFTKRVIRRSPPNFGAGSYHITEWLPETAKAGYQFFAGIGFQGLGNVEFKTDPRDGELKIIECNARFTGAQELITRSGLNMPLVVYNYLTQREQVPSTGFKEFMTLLLPFEDFDAFRDLRATKQITAGQWILSICRSQVFCYFDLDDPKPFFSVLRRDLKRRIRWLVGAKRKQLARQMVKAKR